MRKWERPQQPFLNDGLAGIRRNDSAPSRDGNNSVGTRAVRGDVAGD